MKRMTNVILLSSAGFALTLVVMGIWILWVIVIMEHSTYSIVALDPDTGDVGIAGASCVPISAGAMATFVPGKGAAVTQAAFTPQNQSKVFDLLLQGATAEEIISFMSNEAYDANADIRQYGAVTLSGADAQVAGYTGSDNNYWAGDSQDMEMAVSVQGNTLAGPAVVADALDAFHGKSQGELELSDRLLRALEAASAAGGDKRCNHDDFQQTAQAAFIAVSKADQLPYKASLVKDPAANDPSRPWLYISVIEAKSGPNPLVGLRTEYDQWRVESLPPCPSCDLDAIPVPTGGGARPIAKALLQITNRIGLWGLGVGCLAAGLLIVLTILFLILRRRVQA